MPKITLPNIGSIDSLGVLFVLLPGLLTCLIVKALTSRERKLEAVEVVLHALAYTLIVHAVWSFLTLWSWIPTPDIVGLSIVSVVLGLIVAKVNSRGWIFDGLRHVGLTAESSWQSTWESSFRHAARSGMDYVVLHFKDGRRVMGEVRGYSAEQLNGHITLDRVKWLVSTGNPIEMEGLLVVAASDVVFVQFLPCTKAKP